MPGRALDCGIFLLTDAAEFALHLICSLPRLTSPEPFYQTGQLHQVRHAEKRALLVADQDDLRIREHEVRPRRGHGADGLVIHL